ncbi:MAG: aquaporin [Actinobacteria bacterium]|nr:aquaporin [Actinomycetota bacterium]
MTDPPSGAKSEDGPRTDLTRPGFTRRLGAEFLGALLFVALVSGAACALLLAEARRLASIEGFGVAGPQIDFFESMLATSNADLVTVALAAVAALAVIVPAFGRLSGGHFNPAVTVALAAGHRFGWNEVAPYVAAQCLGGVAGGFLIAALFGVDGVALGSAGVLLGAPVLAGGVSQWQALAAEATVAFVWMIAVLSLQFRSAGNTPAPWSGALVGVAVGGALLVAAPLTGGSANFARSLGPLIASLPFDAGSIPWGDLLLYAAGPLGGALAAIFTFDAIIARKRPRRERRSENVDEPEQTFIVGTTDKSK